jgi:hypothetical protein
LVGFPLNNGVRLDIQTALKGVDATFEECLKMAPLFDIEEIKFPFLHLNHLIANKVAVNLPKDQIDVIYLQKIKKLKEEQDNTTNLL